MQSTSQLSETKFIIQIYCFISNIFCSYSISIQHLNIKFVTKKAILFVSFILISFIKVREEIMCQQQSLTRKLSKNRIIALSEF